MSNAKSKLEYFGAVTKNRMAMGADRDFSSGAHNHKQGPDPESTVSPRLSFNFNCLLVSSIVTVGHSLRSNVEAIHGREPWKQ